MEDIISKGQLLSIKSVKPLDDYFLLLTFSNSEERLFDVKSLFNKTVYKPLQDKDLFNKVHIIFNYTIAWNDEIDLCPDSLYRDSIPYV